MSEWKRKFVTTELSEYRTGWYGAWDAFVAALRRSPRAQVPATYTFSVMVKGEDSDKVVLEIARAQVEVSNEVAR